MAWRELTESALAGVLSQREIDAFREDGALDGADPAAALLQAVASHVRGFVLAGGCRRPGPEGTVPQQLEMAALNIAAAKILKRMNVPMNEDRRRAAERAEDLLAKVAAGEIPVEPDGEDGESAAPSPARPASLPPAPARMLD